MKFYDERTIGSGMSMPDKGAGVPIGSLGRDGDLGMPGGQKDQVRNQIRGGPVTKLLDMVGSGGDVCKALCTGQENITGCNSGVCQLTSAHLATNKSLQYSFVI